MSKDIYDYEEKDCFEGQRHLKLPIPKKETIQGIVNLLNEFSKKL